VAGNNEERPFIRDQRRWVYASAKGDNNYFDFGTDNDLEYTAGHPVIKHRTFGRAVPPCSRWRRPAASSDPALIETDAVEVLTGRTASTPLDEVYGYRSGWGRPSATDRAEIIRLMTAEATQGGSAPPSPDAVGRLAADILDHEPPYR
jgi:hypothetical protein